MAEKIRYFLEQSVPELQDLQNKGLFDKNEITMIMRRRTDFEHRIQSRGCKVKDYLKYLTFEKNLEKLRTKRYKRLSSVGACITKKSISDYAGIKKIFFIYKRAVDRYPPDISLWNSYLKFAKKNGSTKVIYDVYTKVLQLHPTNIRFWINAANYEFEENFNVKASRILFQRGLRFNPDSLELWLAYTEFELLYITKLLERRRILGLLNDKKSNEQEEGEVKKSIFEEDEDVLKLPNDLDDDTKDILKQLPEADMNMLGNPEQNPALRGDIALTIFDVAIKSLLKKFGENESKFAKKNKNQHVLEISEKFLKVFDNFSNLNRLNLSGHVILESLRFSNDVQIKLLDVTLPIRYSRLVDKDFVEKLKLAVNKFMAYKVKDNEIELVKLFENYLNEKFINSEQNTDEVSNTINVLQTIIKTIAK